MTERSLPTWPAPTATTPVDATVTLPGSKSLTNRALVLAALADGPSRIRHPLTARDTLLMAAALRELGALIDDAADGWAVTPGPIRGGGRVDCGLAGTVMRFVPPIAALADGDVYFDGDPHARNRPMSVVLDALRTLGAAVDDGGRGALPFTIRGATASGSTSRGGMPGGAVTVDASASSQFVSGLLLSGARYDKGVAVHHEGERLPSLPHIEMTVAMLREHGVEVDDDVADTWRVEPGPIQPRDTVIEPDLSNAAPFLAAALITGGSVRVPRWPARTTQPGDHLRGLLEQFGATCELDDDGLVVRGSGTITGVDADLRDVGELTPVLAALAALASTPSSLRGIAHLRGHETDRLAALAAEINGLGGDVTETDDGLAIRPVQLRGGVFRSYADHRMAQAGAVLGLAVAGVEVEDIETTSKTLPDFPGMWSAMLAGQPSGQSAGQPAGQPTAGEPLA